MSKLQERIGICISDKPDIVCIVELWLSMDISNNEVAIQGYNIIRWIEIDMEEEFEFMFVSLFLIKLF